MYHSDQILLIFIEKYINTYNEKLNVPSVQRTWELILDVLASF